MAFGGFIKQSTSVDVLIGPFLDETTGKDIEAGLTIEDEHVLLSKNGQGLAAKNDANDAANDGGTAYYNCPLNTTDTNTVGQLTLTVHISGALPIRFDFQVIDTVPYDEMFKDAAAGVQGVIEVNNLDHLLKVTTGVAADGDLSSHVVDQTVMSHLMTATADTDKFKASTDSLEAIKVHADTIKAETASIQTETTALDTLTKASGDGDLAAVLADTNAIQGKLPTNKFMGSSDGADDDGNINDILTDTGTTIPGTITTMQNDLDTITGASGVLIDTDAVDADAIKTDAVDLIWANAMSDLATGAPSATASVLTAINYLYEALRNKTTTTATLISVKKDDGSTDLMKSTISDDATTFVKGEFVSG